MTVVLLVMVLSFAVSSILTYVVVQQKISGVGDTDTKSVAPDQTRNALTQGKVTIAITGEPPQTSSVGQISINIV